MGLSPAQGKQALKGLKFHLDIFINISKTLADTFNFSTAEGEAPVIILLMKADLGLRSK